VLQGKGREKVKKDRRRKGKVSLGTRREGKREAGARIGNLLLFLHRDIVIDLLHELVVRLFEHGSGEGREGFRVFFLRVKSSGSWKISVAPRAMKRSANEGRSGSRRTFDPLVPTQLSNFFFLPNKICLPSSLVAWNGAASM